MNKDCEYTGWVWASIIEDVDKRISQLEDGFHKHRALALSDEELKFLGIKEETNQDEPDKDMLMDKNTIISVLEMELEKKKQAPTEDAEDVLVCGGAKSQYLLEHPNGDKGFWNKLFLPWKIAKWEQEKILGIE